MCRYLPLSVTSPIILAADHGAIELCGQRYCENVGCTQRHDDELLRVITDFQCSEYSNGYFGYRVHIGIRHIA